MFHLVASCAFGLESVVKYELKQLGYDAKITNPGKIEFQGDEPAICYANLWLRTADRVTILLKRFQAHDFDALFETTKLIDWEEWIPRDGIFPVVGRSRNSQLSSVPAIQRAVKRAIVDRLKDAHQTSELPETNGNYKVEIALLANEATLTLDTTGPSLHKRGYRTLAGPAPLKETMAAALVQLSFWNCDRSLIDPFCGTGTIPIEAALIGRNIAPGLNREFHAEQWPRISPKSWLEVREEARSLIRELPSRLIGTDVDASSLSMARFHARKAGVEEYIHFQEKSFDAVASSQDYGCLITNPPYGERIGEGAETQRLYESIPEVLRKLPTWSHFILTAFPNFERFIQKQADRRRKLYNGRIECTYYQFHGPKPGGLHLPPGSDKTKKVTPVFGGLSHKATEQAEIFRSRLLKRAKHLRRWPSKQDIHCYRLYERDVPEIPLIVDKLEDHLHISECERPHDRDLAQHADWLDLMKMTAGEAIGVDPEKVFLKRRIRQKGTLQHERVSHQSYETKVREGGLQFWVNLSDYLDTGLFLDHRITRSQFRDDAKDARVLNLFSYTGAFSVYAADGAAQQVTTVDWSKSYTDWAQRNMALNQFVGDQYEFVCQDVREFAARLRRLDPFDLAIVDPPTFSNSKRTEDDWQIQRDHVTILNQVLENLTPQGKIYFSTNFRRFKLDESHIAASSVREISRQTVPLDFRNRRIHRCWIISK